MTDDLNIRHPADGTKINVNESWELKYWTEKENVSEAELREAVKKVGASVVDVREYLNK